MGSIPDCYLGNFGYWRSHLVIDDQGERFACSLAIASARVAADYT